MDLTRRNLKSEIRNPKKLSSKVLFQSIGLMVLLWGLALGSFVLRLGGVTAWAVETELGTLEGPGGIGEVTDDGGKVGGYDNRIAEIISTSIGVMTILSGIYFLVYFMIAALNWISSGGDTQKLEQARTKISQAFIGLVLTVAAYSIVYILSRILGFEFLNLAVQIAKLGPKQ